MDATGGLRNFPQLAASPLFPLLLLSLTGQKHSPLTKNSFKTEYDYIIVGAGSAGSVVARRLSEMPCMSVLLLEAGGAPPLITELPGITSGYFPGDLFWNFTTVPKERAATAFASKQSVYVQGRVLGGSSVVNAMSYLRGNRHNYDEWASLGAEGWSYQEVLPYFKKLENVMDLVANEFHGIGGPVTVSRPNYNPKIKKPLMKTVSEMGYDFGDSTGARQYGFDDFQATMRNGQRCSTAKAYLVPSDSRPNLDILPNAWVTKILFDGNRATGVRFEFNGTVHEVTARKEIILSAGAINTPRLLMLSGVGPEKELAKLKIPLVADLPVGNNFHDQVATYLFYQINDSVPIWKERFSDPTRISNYIFNREGPLASCEALHAIGFLSANDTGKIDDKPDYELMFFEAPWDFLKIQDFPPEVFKRVFGRYQNKPIFACATINVNPKSIGTIRLQSADPKVLPRVDPNVLDDPKDFEVLLEGMKNCYKILSHPTMSQAGAKILPITFPGCESLSGNLDEFFRCSIKSYYFPFHHLAGSAKMGHPLDPTTVVDPQLRVKSIQGLRVVDASIMPKIIWGHPNVPTIMIGEKGSDMIKNGIKCE